VTVPTTGKKKVNKSDIFCPISLTLIDHPPQLSVDQGRNTLTAASRYLFIEYQWIKNSRGCYGATLR
jgi:hypothetical protein